jgi:hypothetical protein
MYCTASGILQHRYTNQISSVGEWSSLSFCRKRSGRLLPRRLQAARSAEAARCRSPVGALSSGWPAQRRRASSLLHGRGQRTRRRVAGSVDVDAPERTASCQGCCGLWEFCEHSTLCKRCLGELSGSQLPDPRRPWRALWRVNWTCRKAVARREHEELLRHLHLGVRVARGEDGHRVGWFLRGQERSATAGNEQPRPPPPHPKLLGPPGTHSRVALALLSLLFVPGRRQAEKLAPSAVDWTRAHTPQWHTAGLQCCRCSSSS